MYKFLELMSSKNDSILKKWHFMSRKQLNKDKLMYFNFNSMIYLLTCKFL